MKEESAKSANISSEMKTIPEETTVSAMLEPAITDNESIERNVSSLSCTANLNKDLDSVASSENSVHKL